MSSILVLHGPNLNLLGSREPHIYGYDTLDDVNARLENLCADAGFGFDSLQSNSEAELIDRLHLTRGDGTSFLIINPGGLTHTSVALRDALLAIEIPFIEVHLSNPHAREPFRHQSYLCDIAIGTIAGLGAQGYELAAQAAFKKLAN